MTKYGKVAIESVELCVKRKMCPTKAWEIASKKIFDRSLSSIKKG